jgi:hypothetical protein
MKSSVRFLGVVLLSASNDAVEVVMIGKDYKWPSSKRRRAAKRSKVMSQALGVAVGLNAIAYALTLLIPNGMWLALGLLTVGSAFTTAIVQDILNDA